MSEQKLKHGNKLIFFRNTFRPLKEDNFDKVIYEAKKAGCEGHFVSSVWIIPKMKAVKFSSQIKVYKVPVKRISFKVSGTNKIISCKTNFLLSVTDFCRLLRKSSKIKHILDSNCDSSIVSSTASL